jgi:hypothetical protein
VNSRAAAPSSNVLRFHASEQQRRTSEEQRRDALEALVTETLELALWFHEEGCERVAWAFVKDLARFCGAA